MATSSSPGLIPDNDPEWVQPYALSKELEIYASIVYGYLKQNKLTVKEIGGKKHVLRSEVLALREMAASGKRGFAVRPRTKALREESGQDAPPAKPGAIITWGTRVGKRIAQVSTIDETFAKLRDIKADEVLFRTTSLKKLLADGTMRIEDPLALLRMVADAFRPIDLHTAMELDAIVEAVAPQIPHLVEEEPIEPENLPDPDDEVTSDSDVEDEPEEIDRDL